MEFGKVADPGKIDFTLPKDAPETTKLLKAQPGDRPFEVYEGCAKWNRGDLKGFYPRGTKDELQYYATQFNSIELNTTHYRIPDAGTVRRWREAVGLGFKFCPKLPRSISHERDTQSLGAGHAPACHERDAGAISRSDVTSAI